MDCPRRKPLPASSPLCNTTQASPGNAVIALIHQVPASATAPENHTVALSGSSSSQQPTYDISQTAIPLAGAGGQNTGLEAPEQARQSSGPEPPQNEPSKTSQQNSNHRPWNTPWLSGGTFIAFAILFSSFLIALLCIFSFSKRSHGFVAGTQSNQYAWKYGPTAGTLYRDQL